MQSKNQHVSQTPLQPRALTPATAQMLQRSAGNRAVMRLLAAQNRAAPDSPRASASQQPVRQRGGSPGIQAKRGADVGQPAAHSLKNGAFNDIIQRWPYDKDGRDLNLLPALDKFSTIGGGASGLKNYGAEKLSGVKMPPMAGHFFKGLDVMNTGAKFASQGVTEDSVGSGMSTALNFVPPLMMFNLARGGYDATMSGLGKDNWTSSAMMGKFFGTAAKGWSESTPEERAFFSSIS